jgi:hypothetical protein
VSTNAYLCFDGGSSNINGMDVQQLLVFVAGWSGSVFSKKKHGFDCMYGNSIHQMPVTHGIWPFMSSPTDNSIGQLLKKFESCNYFSYK